MKDQPEIPEALRLVEWFEEGGGFQQGTKAPHKWVLQAEQELRRLHAESELHLQELRSYRITVENREARIAELEAQLAAAQQGVQPYVRACIRAELENWHIESGDLSHYEALADSLVSALKSATHHTTQGLERQKIDPLRQMIAQHQAHLEQSPYAYFELAYTRQTGWMVWITDKPAFRQSEIVNPDRKVLWHGQGDTPDEACEKAAQAAQAKQAEAMEVSRSGGCGCCSNACADRSDGCRHVNENPSAADMREKVNRYCGCGMCLETDKEHEPSCHRSVSQAKQGEKA